MQYLNIITSCTLFDPIADNSNIELLNGTAYRLPLKDPLTISLYFGSYPRTNLTEENIDISLVNSGTGVGIRMEPVIDKLNPYHVDIRYSMVEDDLSGDYDIRIGRGSTEVSRQPITINVTGKLRMAIDYLYITSLEKLYSYMFC